MKKLPKVDNVNAPVDKHIKYLCINLLVFHLDLQLYLQLLYSISYISYLKICLPS